MEGLSGLKWWRPGAGCRWLARDGGVGSQWQHLPAGSLAGRPPTSTALLAARLEHGCRRVGQAGCCRAAQVQGRPNPGSFGGFKRSLICPSMSFRIPWAYLNSIKSPSGSRYIHARRSARDCFRTGKSSRYLTRAYSIDSCARFCTTSPTPTGYLSLV